MKVPRLPHSQEGVEVLEIPKRSPMHEPHHIPRANLMNYNFTVEQFHTFIDPIAKTGSWLVTFNKPEDIARIGELNLFGACCDDHVEDGPLLREISFEFERVIGTTLLIRVNCKDASKWLEKHPIQEPPPSHPRHPESGIYRMVIACLNDQGNPDFALLRVQCSQSQIDTFQFDICMAERWAAGMGEQGRIIIYNCETSDPGRNIVNSFQWDNTPLYTSKEYFACPVLAGAS